MYLRVTPAKGAGSLSVLVSHLLRAAPWNINSSEVLAFSGCTWSGLRWPKKVLQCAVRVLARASHGHPGLSVRAVGRAMAAAAGLLPTPLESWRCQQQPCKQGWGSKNTLLENKLIPLPEASPSAASQNRGREKLYI